MTITAIQQNSVPTEIQNDDVARMAAAQSRTAPQQNEVVSQSAMPTDGASTPTGGARTETQPSKAGWRSVAEEVEERLSADPDYAEIRTKYDTYKGMADDFALVDQACWFGSGDGALGLADIQSVANDPHQTEAARNAAKRLLADMSVFNEAAKGNQQLKTEEVMEFLKGLKTELSARKSAMTDKVEAEHAKKDEVGRSAGQSTSSGGASATSSLPAEGPKPAGSTKAGIDGAMENLENMAAYYDAEINKLSNSENPADPEVQKKIAELTQKKTLLMQMQMQLMQMMQNIAKMWSDVSRNAIQNMR